MEPKKSSTTANSLSEEIFIRDIGSVAQKIGKLKTGPVDKLMFVSDFDGTLTKRYMDFNKGAKCDTTWSLIEKSVRLPEEFRRSVKANVEHYYPLISNPTVTLEVKRELVYEWIHADKLATRKACVTKSIISECVKDSLIRFRDGANELFRTLQRYSLRCFIVTAGIKTVVQEVLNQFVYKENIGNITDTITLCATEEKVDEKETIIDFIEPIVLPHNKFMLFTPERFPAVRNYQNAIVMGDIVEDLLATKALDLGTTLTIGFDNLNEKAISDKMLESYDIVIKNDGSLGLVTELVHYLATGHYAGTNEVIFKLIYASSKYT